MALLYQMLRTKGLKPDTMSFNAALNVCERCKHWANALQLLNGM